VKQLRRLTARLGREDGYTMFELLTVLAIFGTVTAALTQLFVSATTSELDSNRRFQAQQEARLALDQMRNQVHCASSASVTSANSVVTLTLPSQCNGTPTTSWCALAVTGYTNRFRLYKQSGTSCTTSGTRYADYLTSSALFSYNAPTTDSLAKLQVTFAVNTFTAKSFLSYTLQDALTLRNSTRAA